MADGEKEEGQLQRAYEEMRRLDEILVKKMSNLRETRRRTKELQAKLWQDLLVRHIVCSHLKLQWTIFVLKRVGVYTWNNACTFAAK